MGTGGFSIGDTLFANWGRTLLQKVYVPVFLQSHLFSYFFEAFYDEIDVFFCMACAYLCTDSCFSLRYYRIGESYYIYALVHHPACKFCCGFFIVQHNRNAWMCSRDDIKSVVYQLFTVVCSNFFQVIAKLCAFIQHIEQLDAAPAIAGARELENRYGRLL